MDSILVTGNEGYIGRVLTAQLKDAGYRVVGLDSGIFRDVSFVPNRAEPDLQIYKDIRDVTSNDLEGLTAVIHLAGLSNDPLGDIDADITYDINYHASVRLAESAKAAGVQRFLFSSSCSVYGVSGDEHADECSPMNPQTPYAESKVWTERDVAGLADETFSPIFLRNATVFGTAPRMRFDLVAQQLAAHGFLTGVIRVLSDGTPWRPLVHVEDVAAAFVFLLSAPRERVHNQAFNIGHRENNVTIKELAARIADVYSSATVRIEGEGGSDNRSYRVNFDKVYALGFRPRYTIDDGVRELYNVYSKRPLHEDDLGSEEYITLKRYTNLLDRGEISSDFRMAGSAQTNAQ